MSEQQAAAPAPADTPPATAQTPPQQPAASPQEIEARRARLAEMERCRQAAEESVQKELAEYEAGYEKLHNAHEARVKRFNRLRPLGYFLFFFIWSGLSTQMVYHDYKAGLAVVLIDLLVGFSAAATVLVYLLIMVGPDRAPQTPAYRRARQLDEVRIRYSRLLQQRGLL